MQHVIKAALLHQHQPHTLEPVAAAAAATAAAAAAVAEK
jgi:hypothetical protein